MSSQPLKSVLDQLAERKEAIQRHPRNRWLSTGVPISLLLGFMVLLALLFGERLLPARQIVAVNVVALAETADEASLNTEPVIDPYSAAVIFQASGWIEPDPLPIKVTALISGVVDEVFVLEGDSVERGALIATLVNDDMRLNLSTAQSALDAARARLAANQSSIEVAEKRIHTLTQQLKAAKALLAIRVDTARRFGEAGRGVVKEIDIIEAREQAVAQEASVSVVASQIDEVGAEIGGLKATHRQILAEIALATTEVERQQLALSRTEIRSPLQGRVMRLLAVPGQQRMLGPDNPDSGAIAYLYDPQKLQARIDVPLADAAQLRKGQAVRLRSNFLPEAVFHGTVTRITGQADLQRNTLQAKVMINDPDERLRPDMLCRAEFLAAAGPSDTNRPDRTQPSGNLRVYVPEIAFIQRNPSSAEVWVLAGSGKHIQRQTVQLGTETREGFVRVLEGLNPGDRVVARPAPDLEAGMRVVANEDN